MEYIDNENPIENLPGIIKNYLNNKVELVELFALKKLGQAIPVLLLGFISLFTLLFFTLFISYSFIQWYAENVGKAFVAALIVSGFYLLITIIIIIFRKALLYHPIQKALIGGLNANEFNAKGSLAKVKNMDDVDQEIERIVKESELNDSLIGENIEDIKDYYSYEAIKDRFFLGILQNPKPAISAILQAIMTMQSFKKKRKTRRQKRNNN